MHVAHSKCTVLVAMVTMCAIITMVTMCALVLEEELRDWVGGNEPVESQSTLNKDSVLLNISFVLRQVNFKLVQQSVDVHQGRFS